MAKITLITGGARSGKSSTALKLSLQYPKERTFIATAVAFDDDMQNRIRKHREERADMFKTIEEPIKLSNAIQSAADSTNICIVDCLTMWCNNIMHYNKPDETDKLLSTIKNPKFDMILVTNEVGMGIVPNNKLSRDYRDLLGTLNQKIAELADNVILMVSGIPVYIKGGG